MTTSFFNGISGLKSFQSGIDVWGDNIANINTPAFKESIPEFSTIFSKTLSSEPISSDIGLGSNFDSNAKDMSEGSLINTDNPFDLALDNKGWFAVNYNGKTYYTRNGAFTKDKDGYLVNDNGAYLIVANANNLKLTNNGYTIDTTINTDNLIKTGTFSPISLPDNVTIPAIATTKIDVKANLDNSNHIYNLKPASENLYFSALYDKNGDALDMVDGESFAYTLGDGITYKNSLFQKEICVNDDKKDGKDLTYDFSVNGKEIKADIPDGSTKEEIINILSQKLKEANIQYKTTSNSIIIESPNNLIIKSNNNLVKNAAGFKFTYENNPKNPYEFNTLKSLASNLQNAINTLYPNVTVNIQDGKIIINNPDYTINSKFLSTDNTNEIFLNNLSPLTHILNSGTKTSSFEFTANVKSFGGHIYDKDGNKDDISFKFSKKEVIGDNTIWQADITISRDNQTISTQSFDFIFNNNGFLISPKSIQLNNPPITINTNLTSFSSTNEKISYSFSQNGVAQGYLRDYEIDQDGNIFANFSNSKSIKVATIPVYHFVNEQGLESIGDSLFKETSNSNKAFLYENNGKYIPGTQIHSGMLESSNVSFSQAMTELIINQKAFSAAAKTVTTSDQMIQRAINMVRG